jgi:hypothetical protein
MKSLQRTLDSLAGYHPVYLFPNFIVFATIKGILTEYFVFIFQRKISDLYSRPTRTNLFSCKFLTKCHDNPSQDVPISKYLKQS